MKSSIDREIRLDTLLPFIAILILCTIFNAILTWNDFQVLYVTRSARESMYRPGENEVPLRLGQVSLMVDANAHYGMNATGDWNSLLPLNHASGVHMNPSDESRYFVSVYHQITCLNTLRTLYMNPGWDNDTDKKEQAHHCLNILRQAVLCNADTTLEPSNPTKFSDGKLVDTASGMDVLHVCRNWEQLRSLSEKDAFAGSSRLQSHA